MTQPAKRDHIWAATLKLLSEEEETTVDDIQSECSVEVCEQTVRSVLRAMVEFDYIEHKPGSPVYRAPVPSGG